MIFTFQDSSQSDRCFRTRGKSPAHVGKVAVREESLLFCGNLWTNSCIIRIQV
jgi:hypothetical protein